MLPTILACVVKFHLKCENQTSYWPTQFGILGLNPFFLSYLGRCSEYKESKNQEAWGEAVVKINKRGGSQCRLSQDDWHRIHRLVQFLVLYTWHTRSSIPTRASPRITSVFSRELIGI